MFDPTRDGEFPSNTWGDHSRDARINEAFVLKEIEAGARLSRCGAAADQAGEFRLGLRGRLLFQKLQEQPVHFLGLLLLYPVASPIHQAASQHLGDSRRITSRFP
jgi:hypothetical protein